MNTDDIIDALGEVDHTCIQNAREPKKKKSRKALWMSAGAVAACLAGVLLSPHISHLIQHDIDQKITPAIGQETSQSIAYAGDFRERNNSGIVFSSRDSMWDWPWEYLFICGQYSQVEYNGITYMARTRHTGDTVSESWIGAKLADYTAVGGYSAKTDSYLHSIHCELYELKGIVPDRFLAVKYEGHDEYYVFMQVRLDPLEPLNPPSTLGDLITDLNLTETFPLTSVYYDSERYSLSVADSAVLWEMFSRYADRGTIMTDFAYRDLDLGKNVMTFTIDAEALGIYNKAWSLTSGGYLQTNIEDYGYYYNLGEDAINEIIDFALSHKKSAPTKQEFALIGEVTEITDTYIKVDDSLCMKNSADGLEFTVELNDLRLKRYIACDRLKVGDHVLISHTGTDTDAPTHITVAYELRIGRIDEVGTIYIEE